MSMIPKGGNTVWGGFNWSPEEGYVCHRKKQNSNDSNAFRDAHGKMIEVQSRRVNYGRIISFGKDVAETPSSKIKQIDFRVLKNLLLVDAHL